MNTALINCTHSAGARLLADCQHSRPTDKNSMASQQVVPMMAVKWYPDDCNMGMLDLEHSPTTPHDPAKQDEQRRVQVVESKHNL